MGMEGCWGDTGRAGVGLGERGAARAERKESKLSFPRVGGDPTGGIPPELLV